MSNEKEVEVEIQYIEAQHYLATEDDCIDDIEEDYNNADYLHCNICMDDNIHIFIDGEEITDEQYEDIFDAEGTNHFEENFDNLTDIVIDYAKGFGYYTFPADTFDIKKLKLIPQTFDVKRNNKVVFHNDDCYCISPMYDGEYCDGEQESIGSYDTDFIWSITDEE